MTAAEPVEQRLSAARMQVAVAIDPQFRLPVRPRALPGLLTVPTAGGLLVVGAAGAEAFSGAASTQLLPAVLAQLDGTRDCAAVAADLGVPERQVRAVVSLLYVRGLVEEGLDEPTPDTPLARWVTRCIDTSRVHRSGRRALEELHGPRVVVLGPPRLAEALAGLLAGNEVTATAAPVPSGEAGLDRVAGDAGLVVGVADTDAAPDWQHDLDRWVRRRGGAWLRCAVTPDRASIGPLFDARVAVDVASWEAGRPRPARAAGPAAGPGPAGPSDLELLGLAMVATEVTGLVARIGTPTSTSQATDVDLVGLTRSVTAFAPGPVRVDGGGTSVALAFDAMVRFPPKDFAYPKGHLMHYVPANGLKQFQRKTYPAARHRELPPVTAGDVVSRAGAGTVGVEEIALLLRTGFGLQPGGATRGDGQVHRYHATGGNLGSPQAYVGALDVPGLPAGWWSYDPFTHRLAAAAPLTDADAGWLRSVAPGAGAVLVATGAVERVAGKYGPFAARVVLMDAGVALHQVGETARLLGLAARRVGGVDVARLGRSLRIDPRREPVTEVVRIDPAGATVAAGRWEPASPGPAAGPLGDREAVTAALLAELATRPGPPGLELLGGGEWDAATWASTLAARRSGRRYGPQPLPAPDLSRLLARGLRAAGGGTAPAGLEFSVLALRVDGLEPGFHSAGPDGGFRPAGALPAGFDPRTIVLQAEFGQAAAIVTATGPGPAEVRRHGAHGYRLLLGRGCAAVNELWLAALAGGAEACGFAGVLPDVLARHGGVDLSRRTPVFAFALGHPAPG